MILENTFQKMLLIIISNLRIQDKWKKINKTNQKKPITTPTTSKNNNNKKKTTSKQTKKPTKKNPKTPF